MAIRSFGGDLHHHYITSLLSMTFDKCKLQEIIDSTGIENFAKEPKLAKLLRVLKWTPVWNYKENQLVVLVCL